MENIQKIALKKTQSYSKIEQTSPTDQDRVFFSVVGCNVLVLHGSSQQAGGINSKGLLGLLCPLEELLNNPLL